MLKKFSINNYRCLAKIEVDFDSPQKPHLIIGKNGSGKSSFRDALNLIKGISRGTSVEQLLNPSDLWHQAENDTIVFLVETEIDETPARYSIGIRFEDGLAQVVGESFDANGHKVFHRTGREIEFWGVTAEKEVNLPIEIELQFPALPMLTPVAREAISAFRRYVERAWIIAPEPGNIEDTFGSGRAQPRVDCRHLPQQLFAAISFKETIEQDLLEILRADFEDLSNIEFRKVGTSQHQLFLHFAEGKTTYETPFRQLSDGQKCFFIAACLSAFASNNLVTYCFWDEPDNYLSLSELQRFMRRLKRLKHHMPILVASHHPETMRNFPDECIFILSRKFQTDPSTLTKVSKHDRIFDDIPAAIAHGELGFE